MSEGGRRPGPTRGVFELALGVALALGACAAFGSAGDAPTTAPAPPPDAADAPPASGVPVRCSAAPWSVRAGDALDQSVSATAVAPNGEVVVAGDFSGTLDFGAGSVTSAGAPALFVAKLDALGHAMWTRAVVPQSAADLGDGGWSASAHAADVAVDAEGNVWVVGDISGQVLSDEGLLQSKAGRDLFAMKLDSSGHILWTNLLGGAGDQLATTIVVNRDGLAFVGGASQGRIDFPDGPWPTTNFGAFTMGLDKDGKILWTTGYSGGGDARPVDMALIPASGRPVVTGPIQGDIDLGAGTLSAGLLYTGAFLASLNPSTGRASWSQLIKGDGTTTPRALAVDANGDIVLTGSFSGYLDLGSGVLNAYNADVFVTKRDANGAFVWAKQLGDGSGCCNQIGTSLAIGATGQILLGGTFDGTIDFGDGRPVTSNGSDIFVAELAPTGTLAWRHRFGSDALVDVIGGVAFDPCGNALVSGAFAGRMDDMASPLGAAGGTDLFVARLSP